MQDNFSNNFRVISEDKQTVKIGNHTMNFTIFQNFTQITRISISPKCTVSDLIKSVKQRLAVKKYATNKIICLESMDEHEVLDYALLVPQFQLSNIRNNESLRLVLEEDITSHKWISLNDFKFKKCLGQGASANVSLVRHKGNGKLYALKQIQKTYFVEFKRMEQVLREKKIMSEIVNDFPFVAKLHASFQSDRHLNFLLEFYPGGEMFFHLHKKRLSQQQARLYFAEMVLTFEFLHQQKVIYRDLKPQNIMIDFSGHARLTDFGLCKINLSKDDLTTSYCGSIQYMAPEVKENNGYNYSVDFYTLGAFLYEMVMGIPPYYNNQSLFFQENSSTSYKNLVKGLIENEVDLRLNSFKQIKMSKWMHGVNWQQIMKGQTKMPFQVIPYQTYIHDEFQKIQVNKFNNGHQQKYDRLFQFFSYMKNDMSNSDLIRFYREVSKDSSIPTMRKTNSPASSSVRKKKINSKDKDKSIRSSSRSKSKQGKNRQRQNSKSKKKSQKSKNSSKSKDNHYTKISSGHIYTKKSREDQVHMRSSSPRNHIVFKKTGTLKHAKSGTDFFKNTFGKI